MKWILHRENRCQELLKRTSSSKRGASFRTRFLNFFLFFSMSIYSREDTFSLFFSFFLLLDFFKRYIISFFLRSFFYVLLFHVLLSIIFVSLRVALRETMFSFFLFLCVNNGIDGISEMAMYHHRVIPIFFIFHFFLEA